MLTNTRLYKGLLPLALFSSFTAQSLAFESFQNGTELQSAVDAYLDDSSNSSSVALKYGWPIGTWLVENVADFSQLFYVTRNNKTPTFNEPLGEWNTSKATSMTSMFRGAEAYNQDLSTWDVSKVANFMFMFRNATSFDQDLCDWGPKMRGDLFLFSTWGMFTGTSCPNKASANLTRIPVGPLCYDCPAPPTASPAPTVTDSPTSQPTPDPTKRPFRTCKEEGVTNNVGCFAKCKKVYPPTSGIQFNNANGDVSCTCKIGTRIVVPLCSDGSGSSAATVQKGLASLMVGASAMIWMVLG